MGVNAAGASLDRGDGRGWLGGSFLTQGSSFRCDRSASEPCVSLSTLPQSVSVAPQPAPNPLFRANTSLQRRPYASCSAGTLRRCCCSAAPSASQRRLEGRAVPAPSSGPATPSELFHTSPFRLSPLFVSPGRRFWAGRRARLLRAGKLPYMVAGTPPLPPPRLFRRGRCPRSASLESSSPEGLLAVSSSSSRLFRRCCRWVLEACSRWLPAPGSSSGFPRETSSSGAASSSGRPTERSCEDRGLRRTARLKLAARFRTGSALVPSASASGHVAATSELPGNAAGPLSWLLLPSAMGCGGGWWAVVSGG